MGTSQLEWYIWVAARRKGTLSPDGLYENGRDSSGHCTVTAVSSLTGVDSTTKVQL
jgi:hypothetical protein